MKKLTLLTVFTIILFPTINSACSCLAPSTFCESITDGNGTIYPEIIIRGEVLNSTQEGKEVSVDQIIHGSLNKSKIIVRADFCTLHYDLEDDNEYIIALYTNNDNYFLIGCAISHLKIENNIVKGSIAPGVNSIKYDKLTELESCGNVFDLMNLNKIVALFPTPTNGVINLKNNSSTVTLTDVQLRIFDITGREMAVHTKADGILPEEVWQINLQDYATGMYIIKLVGLSQENSFKVMKY